MSLKKVIMGMAVVGIGAAGWTARGDAASVPVQDLKLVQEQGKNVDENAIDEDDQAQGDNPDSLAYYYRPYRPYYRPYRVYGAYRPYYGARYYRAYRAYRYYRPYYGYPYSSDMGADLNNLPEPQMDQAQQPQQ